MWTGHRRGRRSREREGCNAHLRVVRRLEKGRVAVHRVEVVHHLALVGINLHAAETRQVADEI